MIEINLPDKYPLVAEVLHEFELLNADLKIAKVNMNTLLISESIFQFKDYEFIELKFPPQLFPDSNFDELYEINRKELKFEQPGNHSIYLKMGLFYTISIITSGILISLGIWAKKNNRGRVIGENGEYHLNKSKKPKEKGGVYMADVSYISYDTASEQEQKNWENRIPVAPTLSIEIVSAKYGLKPALHKMETVWMANGTNIGLVVCPFSKKIFVFEKGKSYTEQSIYTVFTHPLLPDYEGDFSEYVDEIK